MRRRFGDKYDARRTVGIPPHADHAAVSGRPLPAGAAGLRAWQ